MIMVRMVVNVLPQKRLEFTQMITSLMDIISVKPGCSRNAFLQDIKDANRFNMLEEWDSLQNLADHVQSNQFQVLLGSKSLLSQPLDFTLYTVAKTEGVDVITEMRNRPRDHKNV